MLSQRAGAVGRRWGATVSAAKAAEPLPAVLRRGKAQAYDPAKYKVPPHPRVPADIPRPSYADHPQGKPRPVPREAFGQIKGPREIECMRRANGLAANALQVALEAAKEGVTTDEVDRIVTDYVISHGAYPVGINYYGFPRSLCASPNEVALHGVPNTRPLENGDICNFDVTVYLGGAFGDCSAMACIGETDEDAKHLVDATRKCLEGAVAVVGPGVPIGAIGEFCEAFANSEGLGIVEEFCGHFIGSELHMPPNVMHVPSRVKLELQPGMTFTIEPILIEGGNGSIVGPLGDGWTILSETGGWSAQWEHTVLVTEHGAEILTLPK